jgi:hypothetical protein
MTKSFSSFSLLPREPTATEQEFLHTKGSSKLTVREEKKAVCLESEVSKIAKVHDG